MQYIKDLLAERSITDLSIGDKVSIIYTIALSHLNPDEGTAVFAVYKENSTKKHGLFYYPIYSKLFNYYEPTIEYVEPSIHMLSSKYKILKDPFYTTWISPKSFKDGLMYIVEKNSIKGKDTTPHSHITPRIVKTIPMNKKPNTYEEYTKELNLSTNTFSGILVSFIKHHITKIDELFAHLPIDQSYAENLLDITEVKFVTDEGIYIDIKLNMIKKCES